MCMFISMQKRQMLFNYLQLQQSYAILNTINLSFVYILLKTRKIAISLATVRKISTKCNLMTQSTSLMCGC